MNLILFIMVLVISFIVVRIGAIAFQLTGLEWSQAKFQALSCFTSTGFTTKEAELVTSDKQRRRVASVLIVLGHAATGGYGVSKITVSTGSQVLDKTLSQSGLRKHDITVLAVTRDVETIPNPKADTKILLGDELICFGKLENIRNQLA